MNLTAARPHDRMQRQDISARRQAWWLLTVTAFLHEGERALDAFRSALFLMERLYCRTQGGPLKFFGDHAALERTRRPPLEAIYSHPNAREPKEVWVFAKRTFGGPQAVLTYLRAYTPRSNRKTAAIAATP